MPRTALGEGGGLTRTHSDRPKTTHHPQKSGLADFQVENLQAYELSGLAPVFITRSVSQQIEFAVHRVTVVDRPAL